MQMEDGRDGTHVWWLIKNVVNLTENFKELTNMFAAVAQLNILLQKGDTSTKTSVPVKRKRFLYSARLLGCLIKRWGDIGQSTNNK